MAAVPANPPPAGIEQEIAGLYEREAPGMLRYAAAVASNPDLARDAVQEAFFRFFLYRSGGQRVLSPRAWLFRVAHNFLMDQMRAASSQDVSIESLGEWPEPAAPIEPERSLAELLARLREFGLSPREIDCVRLRTENLSYDEIAAVLGLKSGTVGAFLARAHTKIRKALAEEAARDGAFGRAVPGEGRYAS